METFYQIKANFLYLDFNSFIEKEILTSLENKETHLEILEDLKIKISEYLKLFEFTNFYEMPFVDTEGKENGYFIRQIATNKETGLKGKLELMVKRLD